MVNDRFEIVIIKSSNLSSFFKEYKPNIDYPKLEEIFKMIIGDNTYKPSKR